DGLCAAASGERMTIEPHRCARRAASDKRSQIALDHLDRVDLGARDQEAIAATADLEELAHPAPSRACSSARRSSGTRNPKTDDLRARSNISSGSSTRTMRSKPMVEIPPIP